MGAGSKQALDYSAEPADKYSARYLRNSKAIGVLWAVFTVCYGILSVVVLVQPQWVGDTADSPGSGYFGLWRHCVYSSALQVGCRDAAPHDDGGVGFGMPRRRRRFEVLCPFQRSICTSALM